MATGAVTAIWPYQQFLALSERLSPAEGVAIVVLRQRTCSGASNLWRSQTNERCACISGLGGFVKSAEASALWIAIGIGTGLALGVMLGIVSGHLMIGVWAGLIVGAGAGVAVAAWRADQ
jgi:hypothetical protein